MKEYVYRAQDLYENGEDIKCKNPKASTTLKTHILNGSRNQNTKFISTTGRISIAKYKYSQTLRKRTPVILIDLEKLKQLKKTGQINDFRDTKEMQKFYKCSSNMDQNTLLNDSKEVESSKKRTPVYKNFAMADREVVVEGDIPAQCCQKISPLIVDILSVIDSDERAPMLVTAMSDVVMNDGLEVNGEKVKIEDILSKIKFNELEQIFMNEYYSDDMPSLLEMGNRFFPNNTGNIMITQCIQREIIKKIFNDENFNNFLQDALTAYIGKDSPETLNKYSRIISSKNFIGNDIEYSEETRILTQRPNINKSNSKYYLGRFPILSVEVKDGQSIRQPEGMNYKYDKDGNIKEANYIYSDIDKERGESPKKYPYTFSLKLDEKDIQQILKRALNGYGGGIISAEEVGELTLASTSYSNIITSANREKQQMSKESNKEKNPESK